MAGRRRGEALEHALLDAAWTELTEKGYAKFTIDAVAARAGTSRPVLYRRWPNKHELLWAAIEHTARPGALAVPDTGSLRGDVLALLRHANATRVELTAMVSVQLGDYFHETGTSPVELRDRIFGERPLAGALDTIYRRAADRGEIDIGNLTDRMKTLPFDLLRAEVLTTFAPMADADIEEIVDTLFLPLARGRQKAFAR